MSNLRKWFKDRAISVSIALSNVEKTFLAQDGKPMDETTKQERRHNQGTLADNLMRGELTKEVKDLRWRTYKILKNMKGMKVTHEMEIKKDDFSRVKLDPIDPYEVEMVIANETEASSIDAVNAADISAYDYFVSLKNDKPIKINRSFFPKFYLENFTTQLNVLKVSETERLLEFYVSIYPDEYNKTLNLFLKEIKKVMDGTKSHRFLEMEEVGFVKDFLFYEYKVKSFYRILEYNGSYIIKYFADVTANGEDLLKDFVEDDLDQKYIDKVAKKLRV